MSIYSESISNHQKNPAGNMIIISVNQKHSFNNFIYHKFNMLLQSNMDRTMKPITRGIIYWQLNDCWPVSSRASIEYDGRWKQLQYQAKLFFDPLMPTFFETKNYRAIIDGKQTNEDINEGQKLKLCVVNDLLSSVKYTINIDWMDFSGKVMKNWGNIEHTSEYDTVDVVWEIDPRLFNDKKKLDSSVAF